MKIDRRRWNRTLLPVLEELRADLGLADGCRLEAELHSFLVYGPGQFFLPHQDSEKADAMAGHPCRDVAGLVQGRLLGAPGAGGQDRDRAGSRCITDHY